jgi:hypothetical protein
VTKREVYLFELASGLANDWREILKAAQSGPLRCRRVVLRYAGIHTKTIAEIGSVLSGGKIGTYWDKTASVEDLPKERIKTE